MEDVAEEDRMLPRLIDIRAQRSPDRVFAYIPKGDDIDDGFQTLTYGGLAKAVNAAAWWLDETFGKAPAGEFPTIPYIGANDIRYALLVFAVHKTGRRLLAPLTHNTPEALVKLLTQCNAEVVVASAGHERYFDAATKHIEGLRLVTIPEAKTFLNNAHIEAYPYEKTLSVGKDEPWVVMQTSGTTGNPKPLHYSYHYVLSTAAKMLASNNSDANEKFAFDELYQKSCTPNLLPLGWAVGLFQVTLWPLVIENVPMLLPASIPHPPPAEVVHKLRNHLPKVDKIGGIFVPDTLKEIARHPAYLEGLKAYQWVAFAGAPLDIRTGDTILEQGVRVQSVVGATDTGPYPLILDEPRDWKICRLKEYQGFHLQQFAEDAYELCVTRQPHDQRPCFLLNPGCEVYHTRDLWKPVSGRPGFWTMSGRVDDFVKLSSMSKFNATEIERILERHPDIEKTIVAGDGRPSPFVLVQPSVELRRRCNDNATAMVQHLGVQFDEANKSLYDDVKMSRALVLLTDEDLPIQRTAKGTANRRPTLALYEEKIQGMYDRTAQQGRG